jgi:hypothetical protein
MLDMYVAALVMRAGTRSVFADEINADEKIVKKIDEKIQTDCAGLENIPQKEYINSMATKIIRRGTVL